MWNWALWYDSDCSVFNSIIGGWWTALNLDALRRNPQGIRYQDLCKLCDKYFGKPRQSGTSHRVYRTPWRGDPRVNIQNDRGMAKAYQVRQVIKAIEKLEREDG